MDGVFVRALDKALSSFNVERQAYYGGTFIGNHVHKCLEVLQMLKHMLASGYTHLHTHVDSELREAVSSNHSSS